MRHLFFASHGAFANGLASSVQMILCVEPPECFCLGVNHTVDELRARLTTLVRELPQGDELLILTDMPGGSVNGICAEYLCYPNVYVVSGSSLPLALELVQSLGDNNTDRVIADAVEQGRRLMVSVNELFKSDLSANELRL